MKKTKNFFAIAFTALLFSTSCSNEKETISPNANDININSGRLSSCYLPSGFKNLAMQSNWPHEDIQKYLNCELEQQAICESRMTQTASYGPIDIYPKLYWNFNNVWDDPNWDMAVDEARDVAQTGLNQISWPNGATSAFISHYEVVSDLVNYSPWDFRLYVKVYYGFCGNWSPGGDLMENTNAISEK